MPPRLADRWTKLRAADRELLLVELERALAGRLQVTLALASMRGPAQPPTATEAALERIAALLG